MFGRTYHRNTARQNNPRPAAARPIPHMTAENLLLFSQLNDAVEGGKLSRSDREFAASLRNGLRHKGSLTERQLPYAKTLIERATGASPVTFERPKSAVGDMAGVYALFDSSKLKSPKVRLQLADESPIVISKAGSQAAKPGTLNITDGGPFGSNKWYGRIDKAGTWEQAKAANGQEIEIRELLQSFAANPAEVASAYGKLTGQCCFCALPLTDARSTAVGYGKTCAANWGLPWGAR